METRKILQEKLKATLTQITHESLNSTFVGYSELYKQVIFVKVFSQEGKFLTEKTVNEQLNSRVLGFFTIENPQRFILVMKDCDPIDLKLPLTTELAFEMGQELSAFHQNVKPFEGIYLNEQLFKKVEMDVSSLKNIAVKDRLEELLKAFNPIKAKIEHDLCAYSTVVLHGDVGVRNYKLVNGKLRLIDFERARKGVNYQDFIKLFYQDFNLNKNLISSFIEGYRTKGAKVEILPETQVFLIFITAVGIMKYVEKIEDQPFEKIGELMLETCTQYFNMDSGNESKPKLNAIIE